MSERVFPVIILTGLSGSGKSSGLRVFEARLGGGAVLADGLDALGSGVPTHGGTVSVKSCRAAFMLRQVHGLALLTSGVQPCAVALVLLDGFGADRCTEDDTSFTA